MPLPLLLGCVAMLGPHPRAIPARFQKWGLERVTVTGLEVSEQYLILSPLIFGSLSGITSAFLDNVPSYFT